MALSLTLASLGRLVRRAPPPPVELLEAYAHEVIPVLDRAEWLYQYWLEQSTLFSDSEKLGNVAAIHRWETATMGRSLEKVIPPTVLAGAHAGVIDALEMASRAAQLLSSGSRFHNANAVCEGQAMLGASRARRLAALRSMRRYLGRLQRAATADPIALTPPAAPPAGEIPATTPPESASATAPAASPEIGDGSVATASVVPEDDGTRQLADTLTVPDDAPPASPSDRLDTAGASGAAGAETATLPADAVLDETPPPAAEPIPDGGEPRRPVRPGWGALFDQHPPSPPAPRP
jgi:hypothetical protein